MGHGNVVVIVKLEALSLGRELFRVFLVALLGLDFLCKTQTLVDGKPNSNFCSYKFKASGLRCKIASCMRSSEIAWIAGSARVVQ